MTFTNLTPSGLYFQCCHREVAPGDRFTVPWHVAKDSRGLRVAMAEGAVAWISDRGEPVVPGSPSLPTPAEEGRKLVRQARETADRKIRRDKAIQAQRRKDAEAVKANMSRMGNFNVPQLTERRSPVAAVRTERPVTRADVIADDKPRSLADIRRHNRAVKTVRSAPA